MRSRDFGFHQADYAAIVEQFAAETEAVVFLTENYGDEEIHAAIPGVSMREEVVNLAHDIRIFGCRSRVNGYGLVYEMF